MERLTAESLRGSQEKSDHAPLLSLFNPTRETVVSADASSYGLGAVLIQRQPDGGMTPISYNSRSISPTEQRYAQIEKEALALTWACERFSDYLVRLTFIIETDHKPLVPLFSYKNLDELPLRVQRFRMRMMRLSFSIHHVPGRNLTVAPNALSRAPLWEVDPDLQDEADAFVNHTFQSPPHPPQTTTLPVEHTHPYNVTLVGLWHNVM